MKTGIDAKTLEQAFDYHSYGFNRVIVSDGWAIGPAFVVRAPEGYKPQQREKIWLDDKDWAAHVSQVSESMRRYAPKPEREFPVSVDKDKHVNGCSARYVRSPNVEFELAFPLVRILRKSKPSELSVDPDMHVYGWTDDEVCVIVRGKKIAHEL